MIPNRIDIVQKARQDVVDIGINPDESECNRFEITKRAASYLAAMYPEVGLLFKPEGNRCEDCAVDIICLADGMIIDILGQGKDGPNTPLWMINPNRVSVDRWRAPLPYKMPVSIPAEPKHDEPIETKPIEPIPIFVPVVVPIEPTTAPINKNKALAIITTAIAALTWLFHIISKHDESPPVKKSDD